jgi:hypothetical protein
MATDPIYTVDHRATDLCLSSGPISPQESLQSLVSYSRTKDIKHDLWLPQHVLLCFHTALGSNSSQCQQLAGKGGKG